MEWKGSDKYQYRIDGRNQRYRLNPDFWEPDLFPQEETQEEAEMDLLELFKQAVSKEKE